MVFVEQARGSPGRFDGPAVADPRAGSGVPEDDDSGAAVIGSCTFTALLRCPAERRDRPAMPTGHSGLERVPGLARRARLPHDERPFRSSCGC